MADYFTQFSELIQGLKNEEIEWLKGELSPPDDEVVRKKWLDDRGYDTEYADCWPQFCTEIDENGRTLWLFAEQSSNIVEVGWFVHRFLKRWRPKTCFVITYADTCNKLRCGEFGGGLVFATDRGVRFFNVFDEARKLREKFKRKISGGVRKPKVVRKGKSKSKGGK